MSRFMNIWIFLFLMLFVSSSAWGANQCGSTTNINMNADTETSKTYNAGNIGKNTTNNYYMNIDGSKKGTLIMEPLGSNIKISADMTSCPSNPSSSSAITLYISNDRDLNIKLYNSGSKTSASIKFTFIPDHTPPTINDIGTITITKNRSISRDLSTYVVPTDGDPILSYRYTGTLPNGLSFDPATGVISGTATVVTTSSNLKFYASDKDGESDGKSFAIQVINGTPPSINSISTIKIESGRNESVDLSTYVTPTDGDPILLYELFGTLPDGLNFNATTGVISGVSTAMGTKTLTLYASDIDGKSSGRSFQIEVGTSVTNDYRDFTLRKQFYASGDMKTIGNTVLVNPTGSGIDCSNYMSGTNDYAVFSKTTNGSLTLCKYNVDDPSARTVSATTAELTLPTTTSKVVWAGLYWQSIIDNAGFNASTKIKLRRDGDSYKDITPNTVDYAKDGGASGYTSYSAFADVTEYFGKDKWNEGNYTVSGIQTKTGTIASLGTYGAWALVVIYEETDEDKIRNGEVKYRSFSIFDGWKKVANATGSKSVTIPVSGFYTPNRNDIKAKLSVFAAEGDYDIDKDRLKGKNYNTGATVDLGDPVNNAFSAKISGGGYRKPMLTNNHGIDIQTYDIGHLMKPKQEDAEFTFTSTGDTYWPSMLAFSTELVAPELCYDYSYKQDGAYLKADNNGSQEPRIIGYISDSPVEVGIYIKNTDADFAAKGLSLYTAGVDKNGTNSWEYVTGTVATSNVNGSTFISRSETTGGCNWDDVVNNKIGCSRADGNVRIGIGDKAQSYSRSAGGELGENQFVYAKFDMKPLNISSGSTMEVNATLDLKLDYYIKPRDNGATEIPFSYTLGGNIKMCPPTSGYNPTWGTFNVVDHEATNGASGGLPFNNLRTQISRKPFAVDVATYKKGPSGLYDTKPDTAMKTTVMVEMIDNDAYHDSNTSCANPGSAISVAPVFVRINDAKTNMRIPVTLQDEAFHNYAVKNAAFRVWYFVDQNDTLIDWSANTSDAYKRELSSISSSLYESGAYPLCNSSCGAPTSKDCFDCIKINYAKPICSRDNFAVRPESFDMRINDVNQTNTNNRFEDLSNKYGYAPASSSSVGISSKINLAAGYKYAYDMNATGHDTLDFVPGYTRYFSANDTTNYAKMFWKTSKTADEVSGCNDTSDRDLEFYIGNGRMINKLGAHSQVGEYEIKIYDKDWTAVDWRNTEHHMATKGFELVKEDCIETTSSSDKDSTSKKVGCITQTDHTGGGYTYKNQEIQLKPAHFGMGGLNFGIGLNHKSIDVNGSNFVYKSDIGFDKDANGKFMKDVNMSVRTLGDIRALDYNGSTVLSNFVDKCYATDLKFDISLGGDINSSDFKYRLWGGDINSTSTKLGDSGKKDLNATAFVDFNTTMFKKEAAGVAYPRLHLNEDRVPTTATEPRLIEYYDLNVSCKNSSDCAMDAKDNSMIINSKDGTIKMAIPDTAMGVKELDFKVNHLYGRVATYKTMAIYQQPAKAAFEVYLPGGSAWQKNKFDNNWYVNPEHNTTVYGDAEVTHVFPVSGSNIPTAIYKPDGTIEYKFNAFTGEPQSYIAHIKSGGWLWYGGLVAQPYRDPVPPESTSQAQRIYHPTFDITFGRVIGSGGSAKAGSEGDKKNKQSVKKGWKTTNEYAPSIK